MSERKQGKYTTRGGRRTIKPLSERSKKHRSRITNGKQLLPSVHPQSIWARYMRDTFDAIVAHLGGPEHVPFPKLLIARHVSVIDTELLFQADKIGVCRALDQEPDPETLDLFNRMASAERRQLETLGLERVPRDVTPSLGDYLHKNYGEAAEAKRPRGGPRKPAIEDLESEAEEADA